MASTETQEHFAHVLKNGLARSNRFQVLIPIPNALQGSTSSTLQSKTSSLFGLDIIKPISSSGSGGSDVTRGLNLMIESTEIPGKNINTTEIRYNGDFYRIPYSVVYPAQQLTFRLSRDMHEKNIMDAWMNLIYNPINHEIAYIDDYSVNIVINQLDEMDRIVYSVVLREAFPTLLNPLTVSNEESGLFHRLGVMFMYRRWERVGEAENKIVSGGVGRLSQTVMGPILTPILSNPVVKKALDIIESTTGLDLEGEAVAIYNHIDSIIRATTGTSINTSTSVLEQIKASTQINGKITDGQKAQLIDIINNAIEALKQGTTSADALNKGVGGFEGINGITLGNN